MDLPIPVCAAAAVATLTLLWWVSTRRPSGVPPGPGMALPVLGHFHLLKKDLRHQFRAWRHQYGDVFSLYMGRHLVVVLNGYSVMREALVKHADIFSDRPNPSVFDLVTKSKGVGDTSGPLWKAQRKVTQQILRQLGMGRNVLALKVQEEVGEFIRALGQRGGQAFDPTRLIQVSVSNNICSVCFGQRFRYDDPHFLKLVESLQEMFRLAGGASYCAFLPFLRYLPGDVFQIQKAMALYHYITDTFLQPIVQQHLQRFQQQEQQEEKEQEEKEQEEKEQEQGQQEEQQEQRQQQQEEDFISAYLREARMAPEKGTAEFVNEVNLQKVLMDLFAGGTDTSATALRWSIIYFLHYPEVQERCYQDLLQTLGGPSPITSCSSTFPTLADRARLPYLQATIDEVLRIAEVVPLGIAHAPAGDAEFLGWVIPKDAYVLPNLDSVLHDPQVWRDPEVFRPERFLGEEGELVRVDEFLPFSLGRRVCLGESLARMEMFLYLSAMVTHFRFLPPEDGQLPSLQGDVGLVHDPKPFLVRALPRN